MTYLIGLFTLLLILFYDPIEALFEYGMEIVRDLTNNETETTSNLTMQRES